MNKHIVKLCQFFCFYIQEIKSMEMGLDLEPDLDNVLTVCDFQECQNCHIDCVLRNNDNVTRGRPPFM